MIDKFFYDHYRKILYLPDEIDSEIWEDHPSGYTRVTPSTLKGVWTLAFYSPNFSQFQYNLFICRFVDFELESMHLPFREAFECLLKIKLKDIGYDKFIKEDAEGHFITSDYFNLWDLRMPSERFDTIVARLDLENKPYKCHPLSRPKHNFKEKKENE